jgi:ATP-binding cassette subfamily B protein
MTMLAPPVYKRDDIVAPNRITGLWRMMSGFRLLYLGATLFVGLAALSRTGVYLLLSHFIDDVLPQPDVNRVALVGLGFVGLAVFQGLCTYLGGRLAARTAEGITLRLRNYLFDHIQRLPFGYHDNTQTGELIQRVTSDVDAIRRFFADQVIGASRIVLLFTVNFVALANLNLRLALISIIAMPFIILMSYLFFRKMSKMYEGYQNQEAVVSTTLQENLTGVRVVRAFARQDHERSKFQRDSWEKYRRGRRLTGMHALYWPLSELVSGLQMVVGFGAAALMTIDGTITVGGFLAYVGLIIWLIWPIRNLGRMIVRMSTGLISFGRIAKLAREEREPLDEGDYTPAGGLRGEIEFDDVGFEYDDGGPVLEGISVVCEAGASVALLGSTGSGKTSLINLLPRFYEYTSGSLTLDGVELHRYPRSYLRSQIGIVEQEPFLFSRTIRENITYGVGRDVPEAEVESAARSAAIHETIMSFPDGYDTLVGEKGVTLSGGQKQRVAIARTLLKDPRVLILDDSTSSVDTETEGLIRAALRTLMQGRTTFIIAHRVQSVMDADQILVLDEGRIVERGVHGALMAQGGIYREIYDLQARLEIELEEDIAGV